MKINSVQSNVIEWVRFFCASAVVLIHARGGALEKDGVISCYNGVYDLVRILFSEGLCRVAVPVFFFISGYLFFVHLEEWNYRIWIKKLKKRIRSLLLPYIFWNLICAFCSLGMICLSYFLKGGDAPSIVDWYDSIGGLRLFWDSRNGLFPYNLPLWFIRDLIVLVIISPIVFSLIQKTKLIGLLIIYLAFVLGVHYPWVTFFQGLFYFSLGAYFSIFSCDFTEFFEKYRIFTTCIAIPLLVIIVLTYGNSNILCGYAVSLFSFFGTSSLIGIVTILIKKKKVKVNRLLSNSSFFIFAAHYIMLPIVMNGFNIVFPMNQYCLIVKYFTISSTLVAFLVFIYLIMSKMMPKTTSVLTGGRTG
jgi:surface polysaccharide O-acyltransferase-like enzyme